MANDNDGPASTGQGGGTGVTDPVIGFIEPIEIQEEMERSFLEYSMSVIVSRALPDVRDGLKPVHRRILYSMFEQNLLTEPPAREVRGGRRRGHGALPPTVTRRSTTPWCAWCRTSACASPLIDGHGNFGRHRGPTRPAAMRYTEARLAPSPSS